MKKIFAVLGVVAGLTIKAHAFELNIDPNQTGAIAISSTTTSPTLIFSTDITAMRTYIINTSTASIFVVGASTTGPNQITAAPISTSLSTGTYVVQGSSNVLFSPDGNIDPYRGPMWAATNGITNISIYRFRAH